MDIDRINPAHYKSQCSLECIEAMEIAFGNENVLIFCLCNAFKYLWRHENKGKTEDLEKASWYVDKAREELKLVKDHKDVYEKKLLAISKIIIEHSHVLGTSKRRNNNEN